MLLWAVPILPLPVHDVEELVCQLLMVLQYLLLRSMYTHANHQKVAGGHFGSHWGQPQVSDCNMRPIYAFTTYMHYCWWRRVLSRRFRRVPKPLSRECVLYNSIYVRSGNVLRFRTSSLLHFATRMVKKAEGKKKETVAGRIDTKHGRNDRPGATRRQSLLRTNDDGPAGARERNRRRRWTRWGK